MSNYSSKGCMGVFWVFFLLLLLLFHFRFLAGTAVTSNLSLIGASKETLLDKTLIPNHVHFVHLVPTPANTSLEFSFRQFLAIYSASYHLRPDIIYIHTNCDNKTVDDAKRSPNQYTRAVSNLPTVMFNHEVAPNHTTSGLKIPKLANQSDFVRTKVLQMYGGIYLDGDAYVLKDLLPLRRAGFENVVGWQKDGQVCPAVMLSISGNDLMNAYHTLQDRIFDGGWATHATSLLTTLVRDFSTTDNTVLSLPQDAYFPGSWEPVDLTWMYKVHDDQGPPVILDVDTHNQSTFLSSFQLKPSLTWQRDWRTSYTLHGWTAGLRHLDPKEIFGEYGGITMEYVMAQNSNFARAVYPALHHAVIHGVLKNSTWT